MSDHEIKNTIQPWIVSLGISIFCCALFFAFMSNYVGMINASLKEIDERLASIEARAVAASSAAPSPNPVQVIAAPPVPQPAGEPSVLEPSAQAPVPSGNIGIVPAPSPVPAPEAATPVLPSVPANVAPINADAPGSR